MKNREYTADNAKDKFLAFSLFPHLIERIKSDQKIKEDMASMYIFPYRTKDGTRLGSLREPNIAWYYDPTGKNYSGDGYRILDESIFKKDVLSALKEQFSTDIKEYSSTVVIEKLISKMSNEITYSELWWTYAYDVFTLWNDKCSMFNLQQATNQINSNAFLFQDNDCSDKMRQQLIAFNVVSDIQTGKESELFWNKINPPEEMEKAIKMLILMGVPHSFAEERSILPQLLSFADRLSSHVEFPVSRDNKMFEECQLCHDIFTQYIFKDYGKYEDDIQEHKSGIVVRNVNDEFVPISWTLYYNEKKVDESQEDFEVPTAIVFENEFERYHIDASSYTSTFVKECDSFVMFSEVSRTIDCYHFGGPVDAAKFYQWIWHYSQHEELIQGILSWYSNDGTPRNTVPQSDIDFVLKVLTHNKAIDNGYAFDIKVDIAFASSHADQINLIKRKYPNVYCVVSANVTRFESQELKELVLKGMYSESEKEKAIRSDEWEFLWNHLFVFDDSLRYCKTYLACRMHDTNTYKNVILIPQSDDMDFYYSIIASYLNDFLNLQIASNIYDWNQMYSLLSQEIKKFIQIPSRSILDGYYEKDIDLADIRTFKEETQLWKKLEKERASIRSSTGECSPIPLDNWRSFLEATYHGRCQLCGDRTPSGAQNAHFFTFRMVTESKNKLANMYSNLFCLCPTCHGKLRYGDFKGRDLSSIFAQAQEYTSYFVAQSQNEDFDDDFSSIISEFVEEQTTIDDSMDDVNHFIKPLICPVTVNGKDYNMAFSWEHFIRLAFLLTENDISIGSE